MNAEATGPFGCSRGSVAPLPENRARRRRLHELAAFDQEWIAKLIAQSRQRMADGRLRPARALGRPRYAALDQEHLEHNQEVEVEATKIDFFHDLSLLFI